MRDVLRDSMLLAAALLVAALSSGCSSVSSCSRDEDHIDVSGFVNADRTVFSSVDPLQLEADGGIEARFTHFPANRIITFHVGLAGYPTTITPTLSFRAGGDATVAPCAGNQCLIRKRSKDAIVLRNDTCSEFYVWLTASTSATPFQPVSDGSEDEGSAGASAEP
jgi:hypothetical protein